MILNELAMGQSGYLELILTAENQDLRRLQELGFVENAQVKLLRKGPLGSPLLFEVCGTQIGIRKEEAAWFQVLS